jgi:RES domain
VALAEVRPPVGCSVAVARFDIIREVRLLDLTALREAMSFGSVFDPTFLDRLQRAAFLRELGDRITVPVMPDDEDLGYLVTQVIADFLATLEDPAIDGIVFPSVQAKGEARNVVLFHKASRVSPMDLPPGTRVEVNDGYSTEDGWETDYSVFEYEPSPTQNVDPARTGQSFDTEGGPSSSREQVDPDPRVAALAVDPQSVEVHAVEAVGYQTTRDKVRRHRVRDQERRF